MLHPASERHGVLHAFTGDNVPQIVRLRAVTHLDVDDDDIDGAVELIPRALGTLARA